MRQRPWSVTGRTSPLQLLDIVLYQPQRILLYMPFLSPLRLRSVRLRGKLCIAVNPRLMRTKSAQRMLHEPCQARDRPCL